jgi:hypothetical protein
LSVEDQILEGLAVPFPVHQKPEGVRVLAPTGRLGYVPEENLAAAIAAGAKVMTPDDMRALRQEIFMQHGIFKEAHTRPVKRKRRSIVRSGRR